ncbi:MAG: hypothetical protein SPL17_08270, partial [Bacteroidales bacterium]|nr:hypothetical protein [Bacteroidales bacterium]
FCYQKSIWRYPKRIDKARRRKDRRANIFAVELDDRPGMAADAIELFASEGISLAYLYSFLLNGKGVLIFRTDNPEKAAEVITSHGLNIIKEKDLSLLV